MSMLIERKSAISGTVRKKDIPVNPEDYMSWKLGYGSIDDLMPYLSNEDSEFILSGIVKEEWNDFITREMATV